MAKLGFWQLIMLAFGVAVGGAFFLGTAVPLKVTGPSILLIFLIAGGLYYCILLALTEMTVRDPCPGSFRTYAQEQFGPWLGFTVGWVYWAGMILAMSSEATAASIFIRHWISAPQGIIAIIIVLTATILNLVGAELFSRIETSLAAIKILALVGFLVIAGLILGQSSGRTLTFTQVTAQPLLSGGWRGFAGSFLIVMFTYAGMEALGFAAPNTNRPEQVIPRAIKIGLTCLIVIYLAIMLALQFLAPARAFNEGTSPLVTALSLHGMNWAPAAFNLIMPIAIITTMLVAVFSLGRLARALGREGHAPHWLVDKRPEGVPRRGIIVSGLAMISGVSLSFILPKNVYLFLISAGGYSVLFTYLVIVCSHYRFRVRHPHLEKGTLLMPGFPYTSYLTMAALVAIIASMPLVAGQRGGLITGVSITLLAIVAYQAKYYLVRKLQGRHQLLPAATAKPLPGQQQPDQLNNDIEKDLP